MENPSSELNDSDWEIVPNLSPSSPSSTGGGGSPVIRSDHFSVDPNDAAATTTTDLDLKISSSEEEGDDGVHLSCSSVVGLNPHHQGFGETDGKPSEIVQNSESGVDDELTKWVFEGESEEKKTVVVVWWKVPMEVVKYSVTRVSPIWSVSMAAAALMGFVLLRRRYNMKRKMQGIRLSVAVDNDKKVSSRTAILNEAFSVVKRIPIIRPALPAHEMTSWQLMNPR